MDNFTAKLSLCSNQHLSALGGVTVALCCSATNSVAHQLCQEITKNGKTCRAVQWSALLPYTKKVLGLKPGWGRPLCSVSVLSSFCVGSLRSHGLPPPIQRQKQVRCSPIGADVTVNHLCLELAVSKAVQNTATGHFGSIPV